MAVGWPTGKGYVQVQIRVGKAWIPAHPGVVSSSRARELRDEYAQRGRIVKLVPEAQVMVR